MGRDEEDEEDADDDDDPYALGLNVEKEWKNSLIFG